ncbi:MFS transporter-like protein [Dothidotthia symphoricarpi CBS 119687]|uniref:MFS transporter-like protein n=1 Tax=Dothidotthia symphoricarpi CBS 119687 TaxID=1392245 RepID=A0A6A6AQZ2_9PLEO|nr:MFS transporter-like protein [Dothidotthia symphoricarpi CBS 119687]KAF2133623.1 MFS transporter-like protein [Dothidotthia symphoricarpi CBS 119687]
MMEDVKHTNHGSIEQDLGIGSAYIPDLNDKAMEKRIVRKIDRWILPFICISYLINFLDRVNLGNARTLNNDIPANNIVRELSLTGNRFNIAVAVFFVPYVIFEAPSNFFMKFFTPSVWIGRIMISWGIITICTAAVSSFEGLLAVRFFLGVAEAGFFPGVVMYLCYWYKPSERATRLAIFAGSVAVAGAFSGLLATGISFLNGKANLAGWQWLFILTGIPAVLFGTVVWIWMPNYPQDAKFLTPEERIFAVARMGPFAPNKEDKTFDAKAARKTLLDPLFWIYAVSYFFMVNSLNAFSYFSPTIVSNLGFKGYIAQLLTVPPNVFGLIIILTNCLHSDYSKERIRHALAGLALVGTGYLILALVTNWIGRYVAVFLIACTNSAVMPFLAHRTATVSGSTATALATGVTIAISNCGGISAPFLFPSRTGPNYVMGNWTVFAMLCTTFLLTIYLGFRLGTSSEYRDLAPGTADQLANSVNVEGKAPDGERDSRDFSDSSAQDGKGAANNKV